MLIQFPQSINYENQRKYFSTRNLWYFFEIISQIYESRHSTLAVNQATALTQLSVEKVTLKQLTKKSEHCVCRAKNLVFPSNKGVERSIAK